MPETATSRSRVVSGGVGSSPPLVRILPKAIMHVPGCSWMSLDVPGCSWMFLDIPGRPFLSAATDHGNGNSAWHHAGMTSCRVAPLPSPKAPVSSQGGVTAPPPVIRGPWMFLDISGCSWLLTPQAPYKHHRHRKFQILTAFSLVLRVGKGRVRKRTVAYGCVRRRTVMFTCSRNEYEHEMS